MRRLFRRIFHRTPRTAFVRENCSILRELRQINQAQSQEEKKPENISAYFAWNESDWMMTESFADYQERFYFHRERDRRSWCLWTAVWFARRTPSLHADPSSSGDICVHSGIFFFCRSTHFHRWTKCVGSCALRAIPETRCAMNSLSQESRINYNFRRFDAFNYVRRRVETPPTGDAARRENIWKKEITSFLFLPGNANTWSVVSATTHLGGIGRQSATTRIHAWTHIVTAVTR